MYNIQSGIHISPGLFPCGSFIVVGWEFASVGFPGERRTGDLKENEQGATQEQTRLTYDTSPESNSGLIGGNKCSLLFVPKGTEHMHKDLATLLTGLTTPFLDGSLLFMYVP